MRGIADRLQALLHDPKKAERFWCYTVLSIVVIGVCLPMGATHAQSGLMTDALNYLLTFLAYLLQWVIIMLGKLVIFLVDIVIRVAQYNSFTKAAPVQQGWPIIRDVFNMFFIVILLVSAFSTIIGYEKYHYSTIIKKFFLMAALINFSLPLFGLAIDFSQILMLTFVNGFRAAAAGNFVTILKLDKVMTIEKVDLSADNGQNAVENPMVQKVTAMMFGVFILGVSATILAIMVVYLVFRIVGLWILLITSPGALFTTGLPSSLQGKIPGFGGDWWNKLWSLLTGGPIMAFFLWLALATASQVGPTFTDTSTTSFAGTSESDTAEQYFQTAIGSVENFGSYIVAVVMLFTGLSTAVSASGQVAPAAGKLASKIRDVGVGSTKFLAYGGAAAAGAYGARKIGTGIGEIGTGIDRRYGITKSVGTGIQTVSARIGWTGGAKFGAQVAGTRGRAVKKTQEKFEEMTKGLSTGKRMDLARKRIDSFLSNGDERKGLKEMLTKDAFSVAGEKHLLTKYDKEAKDKFGQEPTDEAQKKVYNQKVNAYKQNRLLGDRRTMLAEFANAAGENEDKQKWIKERREAMPSYAEDVSKHVADEQAKDPTYFRKIKPSEFLNAGVGVTALASAGFKGNELSDPDSALAKAMGGQDEKAKILRSWMGELKRAADASGGTIEELLKGVPLEDKVLLEKVGFKGAMMVKAEGEGNGYRMVPADGNAEATTRVAKGSVLRDEEKIVKHQLDMDRVRTQIADVARRPADDPSRNAELGRLNDALKAAQLGMLGAGADISSIYQVNSEGEFGSAADRQNFETNVQQVFQEAKKDYNTYSKVDFSVINKNLDGTNQARQSVIRHANVNDLALSYTMAKGDKNKIARNNIADVVRAIDKEGGVFDRSIDRHNKGVEGTNRKAINKKEIADIGRMFNESSSPLGEKRAEEALQKALQGTSVVMNASEAGAFAKQQDVKLNPLLQSYSRTLSGKAKEVIGRAVSEKTIRDKSNGPVPEIEDASGQTPTRRKQLEDERKAREEALRRLSGSIKPDTDATDKGQNS